MMQTLAPPERRAALALVCLLYGPLASAAAAQEPSPWSATYAVERASVTIGNRDSSWNTDQVLVTWIRPSTAGWQGSIERYRRGDIVDVAVASHGYKRAGDWTFGGGAAASNAPHFIYRLLAETEVSRRIAGTFVGSLGYRFLSYTAANVHQLLPAVTWYHPRGEVSGRLFHTHNTTTATTTEAVLVRAIHDLTPRVRVSGGLSVGTRIFDVAALPSASGESRVAFGLVRIGVTSRDYVEAGMTAARERPDFSYRSVLLTYRRVF